MPSASKLTLGTHGCRWWIGNLEHLLEIERQGSEPTSCFDNTGLISTTAPTSCEQVSGGVPKTMPTLREKSLSWRAHPDRRALAVNSSSAIAMEQGLSARLELRRLNIGQTAEPRKLSQEMVPAQ
jgi:hypothetical protein